jgi:hypothetical protein
MIQSQRLSQSITPRKGSVVIEENHATMAEIARAKVQASRERLREEMRARAKVTAEKAKEQKAKEQDTARKWDDWQDTFYTSGPTRLALSNGVSSTAPKQQSTWLRRNENLERQRRNVERIVESKADPDVLAVLDLQNYEGKWLETPELIEALGDLPLPVPPDKKVPKDLWTTALALSFLRRRPDQFAACATAYERGERWVEKLPWLLEAARLALPPMNNYFELDPVAVREGRWRDSEAINFARDGYEGFTRPRADTTVVLPEAPVGVLGMSPPPSRPTNVRGGEVKGKITSTHKFSTHQQNLGNEFKRLTSRSKNEKLAGRDMNSLRAVWQVGSDVRSERQRLDGYHRAANKVTEWNSDFLGIRDEKPRKLKAPRKEVVIPKPPPRPLIGSDGGLPYLFETILGDGDSKKDGKGAREAGDDDDDDDDDDKDDDAAVGASLLEVDAAQKSAVVAVTTYDAYLAEVAAKVTNTTRGVVSILRDSCLIELPLNPTTLFFSFLFCRRRNVLPRGGHRGCALREPRPS